MKLNRIFALLSVILSAGLAVQAENESLASIFTNAPQAAPGAGRHRTSVIFITCHGLGRGDLSCYGQTNFQTPNLDLLAAGGMRFTDYRVTGDTLAEAQGALMAGPAALAARLQAAGYATAMLGEWTFSRDPWNQGFQEFGGFLSEPEARNYYADSFWRYSAAGASHETAHVFQEPIYPNRNGAKGVLVSDFFLTAAGNYARLNRPDQGNHYRPFFLFLNLPMLLPATPAKDDYPAPTDAPYAGEAWPQAAKNRAALITRLDNNLGQFRQGLNQARLTNNVAIIVAGAAAPEPFASAKLDFFKVPGEVRGGGSPERLRAPMIVYWPGMVPAGKVSAVPWTAADFAPTVMQIADEKTAIHFEGKSVLPVLLGKPAGQP